jgi:dihydroxyacetone kinase DhaKLM complex PTS-EIIA-like component DhaM
LIYARNNIFLVGDYLIFGKRIISHKLHTVTLNLIKMKKILQSVLSVFLALVLFSSQSLAYTLVGEATNDNKEIQAVSSFNEDEIYTAFNEIDELVSTIESNEELTYKDLEATNNEMVANINSSAAIAMNATADTPPFVSAFLWGCIFNWVGMLVVGITTGFDGTQLKKSAWGCLVNSLLFGGGYLLR